MNLYILSVMVIVIIVSIWITFFITKGKIKNRIKKIYEPIKKIQLENKYYQYETELNEKALKSFKKI